MKTLIVYIYAHPTTNLDGIKEVIASKPEIEVVFSSSEEQFVEALTAQRFDLLILDLDLPRGDYKKAQLMTEMIYPGAATTELDLNHKYFFGFKLDALLKKWEEAQSDGVVKFFDNPSFN